MEILLYVIVAIVLLVFALLAFEYRIRKPDALVLYERFGIEAVPFGLAHKLGLATPLLRMALVPRVMEARGLDVTPGMIDRLAAVGDDQTVAALEVIEDDLIGER